MTRVDFYVLRSPAPADRLPVAVRLAEKALNQGLRVFINAAEEHQAQALDDQLWTLRPESFLPHGPAGAADAELIAIGCGQDPGDHGDLLINLEFAVPEFFSRFERVAEVVTQDDASLAALRASWQFYRQRGYELNKHDV